MRCPIFFAVAVLTAGCGTPDRLAELSGGGVAVDFILGELGQPLAVPELFVQLEVEEAGACVELPTSRAAIDGSALEARSRGGWGKIDGTKVCSVPTFKASDVVATHAPEKATHIELADDSASITLQVEGLFAERSLTLVEPADGVLEAGKRVRLRWSSSTDVLDPQITQVVFFPKESSVATLNVYPPALSIDGDELSFDMPAVPAGSGALTVETHSTPRVSACMGTPQCVVSVNGIIRSVAATVP